MKEGLRRKHNVIDEEVKTAEMKRLYEHSAQFYEAGIHVFIRRWNIAIERNDDNVEK